MARLLLINYEFPPLGGGAANATANMARELAALGVEVRVLTSAFAALPRSETVDGVTIQRIPTLRRRRDRSSIIEMLTFLASSLVAAPLLAARWRPDATIAYFGLPCGPAAWMVRRLFGIPYIVSLRGGDVPGFQYEGISLYHRLAGPLIAALWRRAAAVVANSEGLAALARRFTPDLPVLIIPNGVDTALYQPVDRRERPTGPLRLLFVGRLVRQKGLDCLLDAIARLPVPGAVDLQLVGDGPARPELERQAAALGVAGQVAFSGWTERAAMPGLYADADVFVFPSRDEGMPNVVLEAMAAGLPVVATRIAGTRDLVSEGETGLMIDTDDANALASAIARLAADPALRRRLGAQGRRRVMEEFSWRAVAEAYLHLSQHPSSLSAASQQAD